MEKKMWSILIIILTIIATAIIVATVVTFNERARYETFYDSLENQYSSLQNNYDVLTTDYNNLADNYYELSADYSLLLNTSLSYIETIEKYSSLSINHLMAMTYVEIREQVQPKYNPWTGSYYYDKSTADYAASLCAHDLSRRYWPSLEDEYYEMTGNYLSHDAYQIISDAIDIIGISEHDGTADKVERILNFTSNYLVYQSDKNNEFLFPVETLTFRSGDCDDFSILAATLFEKVGIKSAVALFENESLNQRHCMVLVNLDDLGNYGYWYYSDLTAHGLSEGNWIILEPQTTVERQHDKNLIEKWSIIAMAEIPNE